MKRRPSIQLGGPSYCMQVDARHAVTMALLATQVLAYELSLSYKHGTPVDCPRNELFGLAMADAGVDMLVWMDSDCYVPPEDIPTLAKAVQRAYESSRDCVIIPTPQRDGVVNVWETESHKYTKESMSYETRPFTGAHAAGLGLAIFNLGCYRRKWSRAPWFCGVHGVTAEGRSTFMSEDYYHTTTLQERDMKLWIDPRITVRHVHRGGDSDE